MQGSSRSFKSFNSAPLIGMNTFQSERMRQSPVLSSSVDLPSPPVSWRRKGPIRSASREDPSKSGTVGVNSVAATIAENHVAFQQQQQQQQQSSGNGATPMAPSVQQTGHPSGGSVQRNQQLTDGIQAEGERKKWSEERERKRDTWINDPEWIRVESWLDEHPDFCLDYFLRKGTRQMVDTWMMSHSMPSGSNGSTSTSPSGGSIDTDLSSPGVGSVTGPSGVVGGPDGRAPKTGSGAATPSRKVSTQEFERGGLLPPMVNVNVDGTPTFITLNEEAQALVDHYASHSRRCDRQKLRSLDEKELLFELVKDIATDLDLRSLCHKILQNVSILTKADRGSLFLVQDVPGSDSRCLVSKLFDVCSQSTLEEMEKKEEIRIPWGSGIVGYVAQKGETVNIPDAYKDERFNHDVDAMTGYHTRSMLCMPIKDSKGEVIGVAQVINKQGDLDATFTDHDKKVFERYLQFCGISLRNAELFVCSKLENKRNQVMLDLARVVFEEQSTLKRMMKRILRHTQSLIECHHCQVLLVHEASKGTFSKIFNFDLTDDNSDDDSECLTSFPINVGITSYVATTGETVNIVDAYKDCRFDPSVDEGLSFRHKTILCMPIKNKDGEIISVIQIVNKLNGQPFTKNDENFVEAFAIFIGMGIVNTSMYQNAKVAMTKQQVTLEVLSYHATASSEEAVKLKKAIIPSAKAYRLHDYRFNDFSLEDEATLKACLRMFLDLDLIGRFHIEYDVLCRWLLSVKKNYRNVTYHNWRHAFNVAQMMFAIVTGTQWWEDLGEIEVLSLIMACLCHDLDHRGTNNSFQIKASSPLAKLYSTSTMERHHYDQCLMILNSQGCRILDNVTSVEFSKIVKVLEEAILSTDLAVYFGKRVGFFQLVSSRTYDWRLDSHRELLRGMLMTACDVAAITKPWEVQWKVAELVANEFFEQGDIERRELNETPIDMMNREKQDQLPAMQVGFIDSICMPVYEAFASLTEKLDPLLEGVKSNRANWLALGDSYRELKANEEKDHKPKPSQHLNGQIKALEV